MPQVCHQAQGVHGKPTGFSLVELLVVITVIGSLVSLLLSAVQSARESARRAQCGNNIKQLALAALSHESATGFFPTGGWGQTQTAVWLGHPDRGFGKAQPGGWIYNVLPFMEQQPLHDLGASGGAVSIEDANITRLNTPIATMNCPSRRPAVAYTYRSGKLFKPALPKVSFVARSDYAMNAGDYRESADPRRVPEDLQTGDLPNYPWNKMSHQTGISYQRSQVAMAQIQDGSSNTFLIGEKYIDRDYYTTGNAAGDLLTMYCAGENDLLRWTGIDGTVRSSSRNNLPRQDYSDSSPASAGEQLQWFGSAHAGGFSMSLCDGSVRTVNYAIDAEVYRRLGNRKDQLPIDGSRF